MLWKLTKKTEKYLKRLETLFLKKGSFDFATAVHVLLRLYLKHNQIFNHYHTDICHNILSLLEGRERDKQKIHPASEEEEKNNFQRQHFSSQSIQANTIEAAIISLFNKKLTPDSSSPKKNGFFNSYSSLKKTDELAFVLTLLKTYFPQVMQHLDKQIQQQLPPLFDCSALLLAQPDKHKEGKSCYEYAIIRMLGDHFFGMPDDQQAITLNYLLTQASVNSVRDALENIAAAAPPLDKTAAQLRTQFIDDLRHQNKDFAAITGLGALVSGVPVLDLPVVDTLIHFYQTNTACIELNYCAINILFSHYSYLLDAKEIEQAGVYVSNTNLRGPSAIKAINACFPHFPDETQARFEKICLSIGFNPADYAEEKLATNLPTKTMPLLLEQHDTFETSKRAWQSWHMEEEDVSDAKILTDRYETLHKSFTTAVQNNETITIPNLLDQFDLWLQSTPAANNQKIFADLIPLLTTKYSIIQASCIKALMRCWSLLNIVHQNKVAELLLQNLPEKNPLTQNATFILFGQCSEQLQNQHGKNIVTTTLTILENKNIKYESSTILLAYTTLNTYFKNLDESQIASSITSLVSARSNTHFDIHSTDLQKIIFTFSTKLNSIQRQHLMHQALRKLYYSAKEADSQSFYHFKLFALELLLKINAYDKQDQAMLAVRDTLQENPAHLPSALMDIIIDYARPTI